MKFDGLQCSDEDINKCQNILNNHVELLKEIFVHLQGKSNVYPYVDHYTIRVHFIQHLGISLNAFDNASYENILAKADYSTRSIENMPGGRNYCRATFFEIVVRLAQHMYCSLVNKKDLIGMDSKYSEVSLPRAFKMFLEDKLTNYFID